MGEVNKTEQMTKGLLEWQKAPSSNNDRPTRQMQMQMSLCRFDLVELLETSVVQKLRKVNF